MVNVLAARVRIVERLMVEDPDRRWLKRLLLQGQAMALHEWHQDVVQEQSHKASLAALRAKQAVGDASYRAAAAATRAAARQRHDIPLNPAPRWRVVHKLRAEAAVFTPSGDYLAGCLGDWSAMEWWPEPEGYGGVGECCSGGARSRR